MAAEATSARGPIAAKGLATLALLKANFDAGNDHIAMFVPFVLDAVSALPADDFALDDVKGLLIERHGLQIPTPALRTILSRSTRGHGPLRREGGRYFKTVAFPLNANLSHVRAATTAEHQKLAVAFRAFAERNAFGLASDNDALALILEFLARNHVGLLLDTDPSAEVPDIFRALGDGLANREQKLVARFVVDVVSRDASLTTALQRMLEGFVLQNALLLKDIGSATRRFSKLTVYYDTGFLLQALGLTGEAAAIAAEEALRLLRDVGAELAVFEKTIMEIRRVLHVYEQHLATTEGIASLHQTDMTRYVLTRRLGPSDIREAMSLLETNIRALGFSIRRMPPRDARFMFDEAKLTQLIKRPYEHPLDPRVVHDVDCIAAILTLRAGHTTATYDEARAVFATTTGALVANARDWYRGCGETGSCPVIHHLGLSNIAWLKKPASASKLKLHELVALCSSALTPPRRVWDLFTKHLRTMRDTGRLSSEEVVAIVADELTSELLSKFDDDVDPDAQTIAEVVDRVRAQYQTEGVRSVQEAEQRLGAQITAETAARKRAEERLGQIEEQVRKMRQSVQARSRKRSRIVSWALFALLAILALAGSSASIASWLSDTNPIGKLIGYLLTAFTWILGTLGLLWGGYLFQWQRRLEDWLEIRLRKSLMKQLGPGYTEVESTLLQ